LQGDLAGDGSCIGKWGKYREKFFFILEGFWEGEEGGGGFGVGVVFGFCKLLGELLKFSTAPII
jgi:hypothetical protein